MVAKVMAVYSESPPNIGSISQGWSRKIMREHSAMMDPDPA